MRHHVAGRKLNRDYQHRQALIKNLLTSLIEYGSISTSLAKAKAIQGDFDRLMTRAKSGTLHDRRQLHKVLQKVSLVNRLISVLSPMTGSRTSGFTRIKKMGYQIGDDQLIAKLEMIDYKAQAPEKVAKKTTKTSSAKVEVAAKHDLTKALPQAPKNVKSQTESVMPKINAPRKAI